MESTETWKFCIVDSAKKISLLIWWGNKNGEDSDLVKVEGSMTNWNLGWSQMIK